MKYTKLMKGKALRKHSLHEKTAASVFWSCSSLVMNGPQGSWSVHVCCLHVKMEFCSCARGRQWCGIIHYRWWTASIKPRLLFSRAGYALWGLSISSVFYCHTKKNDTCFWIFMWKIDCLVDIINIFYELQWTHTLLTGLVRVAACCQHLF